jgi:Glycosyltransferase
MVIKKDPTVVHLNTNDLKGGAAKVAWRLMSAQRSKGRKADMLVGYRESRSPFVYPFDIDRDGSAHLAYAAEGLLDYDLRGSGRLTNHPLVQGADILHLHNLHGGYFNPFSLIGLTAAKPVVWTLHDMQAVTGHCAYSMGCERWEIGCGNCPDLSLYPSMIVDATRRILLDKRRIYEASQFTIVTPSLWLKRIVERSVLKNHHIELIYNGVDTCLFVPHDKRTVRLKYGLPQDALLIGCVANLFGDDRKGSGVFDSIADSLTEQSLNVKFLKIGKDDPNKRHPAIISTGYIEDERTLSELYAAMDVFLFPSTADNCPLVLSEAMACGVPIVSYRTGGIPEIVPHGVTGFIADPETPDSLIPYLYRLLADENLRNRMSMEARLRAEREYEHRKIADRYEALYLETIEDFHRNRSAHEAQADHQQIVLPGPTHSSRSQVLVYSEQVEVLDKLRDTLKEERVKLRFTSEREELLRSDAEFIYMADPDCEVDPFLFEILLSHYRGQDFITCELQLLKDSGEPFYPVVTRDMDMPDVYNVENPGCMLYRREFFLKTLWPSLLRRTIRSNHASFLHANAVQMRLADYLNRKLAPFAGQQLYLYGAGTHTKVILKHLDHRKYRLCGIVDKHAGVNSRFEGLPIYPASDLASLPIDGLLISSHAYEREMYVFASRTVDPAKIVTLYYPCRE